MPPQVLADLADSSFGRFLLPGLTAPDALTPVALPEDWAQAAASGCDALVDATLTGVEFSAAGWVFASQPTPPPPDGGFYLTTPPDTIPYASRAADCMLRSADGATVHLAGTVIVSRASLELVVATVDSLTAVPGLEILAAEQIVRRPAGLGRCGAPTELAEGLGAMWASCPATIPSVRVRPSAPLRWPERWATWSDGERLIVYVGCSTPADASVGADGKPLHADQFLTDPKAAGYRAREIAEQWAQFEGELVHTFVPADTRTPELLEGRTGAVTKTFDMNQPFADETTPLLPAAVTRLASLGADGTIWVGDEGDWLASTGEPVPDAVRRFMPCAPPECPVLERTADGQTGTTTVGLVRPARLETAGWFADSVLLWTLEPRRLVFTVVSRDAARGSPGAPSWSGRDLRRELSRALPALLGEYGRRLTLVPVEVEPIEGTDWWCVTPDPGHEVGLLERVRVGDTPWGRCRIYADPAVLHIVFDLPEEEGTE